MLVYFGRKVERNLTYINWEVLEAAPRTSIFGHGLVVLENKGDLDDTSDTSTHEGVTEHGVGRGADHEVLGMSRHGPPSDENDEAGNEVALWAAIAISAQPHTS